MRLRAAILAAVLVLGPAAAGEYEDLVLALGHPSWSVREDAQERLRQAGERALPALKAAIDDPDHEVRFRVRKILRAILWERPPEIDDPEAAALVRDFADLDATSRKERLGLFADRTRARGATFLLRVLAHDVDRPVRAVALQRLLALGDVSIDERALAALTVEPSASAAWLAGELHRARGREEAASRAYAAATLRDPGDRASRAALAESYRRQGRYEAALEAYEVLLDGADASDEVEVLAGAAECRRRAGRVEEAVALWRRLVETDPRDRSRWDLARGGLREAGRVRDLIRLLEEMSVRFGQDPDVPAEAALLRFRLGELGPAIASLETAYRRTRETSQRAGHAERLARLRVEAGTAAARAASLAASGRPGEEGLADAIERACLLRAAGELEASAAIWRDLEAAGGDPVFRRELVRTVGLAGTPEALEWAGGVEASGDRPDWLRVLAAMDVSPARDLLKARLSSASPAIRAAALQAIGAGGGAETWAADVEALLGDRSAVVRGQAARALVELRGPGAAGAIARSYLDDPLPLVAETYLRTLEALGSPEGAPAFRAGIRSREPRVRAIAIRGLAGIGDPEAPAAIRKAFERDVEVVRCAAAVALSSLAEDDLLVLAWRALEDRSSIVRLEAARALAGVRPGAARHLLERAFFDPDPAVTLAAAGALLSGGDVRAAVSIRLALQSPDENRRREAVRTAGRAGHPRFAPEIRRMALVDPAEAVRLEAAGALARIGDVEGLLAVVDRTDPRAAAGAAKALLDLASAADLERAVRRLEEISIQEPWDAEYPVLAGTIWWRLGRTEEALLAARVARFVDPWNPAAHALSETAGRK